VHFILSVIQTGSYSAVEKGYFYMMKKTIVAFLTLFTALSAQANESSVLGIHNVDPLALVNWKVGDSADYQMSAFFGNIGSMHKEVVKEENEGVWVSQTTSLAGRKDQFDALVDRNSGKVVKLVHNGKEETVPDDEMEVISEDYGDVTVPAGTFKALHITAKTKQISKLDIWVNNRDVVMDGAIKQVMPALFGNITMELVSQKKMP
jgi:predicted small secreted protein